jgi:hypothetical protein
MIWLFLVGLFLGGMNMDSTLSTTAGQDSMCTVSTDPPITWSAASGDTPLTTTAPTSDRRQKVQFTTATGKARHMEIIYGSTSNNSNIVLTKRNAPEGTPNIQYPDGPGVRVVVGWAFITFQWPLIWMDSIDAGSIGTTAVMNNQEDQADVYLIANKLDIVNPDAPTRPTACTDPEAHMYVLAKNASGACLAIPSGFEAIRRRYDLERDAQGKITKVTFAQQKSLHIEKSVAGRIEVSGDKFLQKVLDCASLQGLYDIP